MKYALSIDWLSLYVTSPLGVVAQNITESDGGGWSWDYEKAEHGTRQFRELITVYINKEEFAEVQQIPCSSILQPRTMIVKFANRRLYSKGLFGCMDMFLRQQCMQVLNISRIDICADFNTFHNGLQPISLIKKFLSSEFRHVGRGIGASHFNHFAKKEHGVSRSYLNYTGLSFGSRESEARVYLYNKSFELLTVHDKPHIRQLWQIVGLTNTKDTPVWRLEVSIKSGGMRFMNKATQEKVHITPDFITENVNISLIYHTFVKSLFSFVKNRAGITNITREPRIQLFNGEPYIERCCLNDSDSGNRAERILIKQLWQMSQRYRGREIVEDEGISKTLATELAKSTNLDEWLREKSQIWKRPKIK